jgi:hypothetical protein
MSLSRTFLVTNKILSRKMTILHSGVRFLIDGVHRKSDGLPGMRDPQCHGVPPGKGPRSQLRTLNSAGLILAADQETKLSAEESQARTVPELASGHAVPGSDC